MRILLIATLVSSVALAGCGGGEKNSSTSANNSASANAAAAGGTAGATGDAFRRMVINQCESGASQLPNAPPGVNAGQLCNCAVETAFGNQADPVAFARSPEGQRALTQAIVSCARQGSAAGKAAETK